MLESARLVLDLIAQTVTTAYRSLKRHFWIPAILTLSTGAGVGATASTLAVYESLRIRPLPFSRADDLFVAEGVAIEYGPKRVRVAASFRDLRQFDSWGLFRDGGLNMGDDDATRVRAAAVDPAFFETLGATPAIGRVLSEHENVGKVAILSWSIWSARFGHADLSSLTPVLNGATYQVIGVMPKTFRFPSGVQIWIPIGEEPQLAGRSFRPTVLVRKARPVSKLEATAALTALSGVTGHDPRMIREPLTSLRDVLGSREAPAVGLLSTLAVLLLLGTMANLAIYVLATNLERRDDFVVRSALGASRLHLSLNAAGEAILIAVCGTALGLPLAAAARPLLENLLGAALLESGLADFSGARFAVIALLVAATVGIIAVAIPSTGVPARLVKSVQSRGIGRGLALVGILHVVVSLILLTSTFSTARIVRLLTAVDFGFDNEHAVIFDVALPKHRYRSVHEVAEYIDQLRNEAAPLEIGASEVGPRNRASTFTEVISSPDSSTQTNESTKVRVTSIAMSPGYLEALGARIVAGRGFESSDRNGPSVALLSEALAERLGVRYALLPLTMRSGTEALDIVGVVTNTLINGPRSEPVDAVYRPISQRVGEFSGVLTFAAMRQGQQSPSVDELRAILRKIDPTIPPFDFAQMAEVRRQFMAQDVAMLKIIVILSLIAMAVSGAGLYIILSRVVTSYRAEFGIMAAVGARPVDLAKTLVRKTWHLVAIGIPLGVFLAASLPGILSRRLPPVWLDDVTSAVAFVLLVIGAATCVPGWRATRADCASLMRE